jgi:hypothetical protein
MAYGISQKHAISWQTVANKAFCNFNISRSVIYGKGKGQTIPVQALTARRLRLPDFMTLDT